MNSFYNHFNKKQYEAITASDQNALLVIAGAGSGKTAVLTYRAVYLIQEKKYDSERILGFTFTNKAANEMKERITKIIPNQKFQFVGTFHSICLRILREDIKKLGLKGIRSNFNIADEDDQMSILKEIYKLNNFDKQILNLKVCLSWISRLKFDNIYDADDVYEWLHFLNESLYDNQKKKEIFAKVYRDYLRFLQNSNLLDFDDLIKYTKQVLQIKEIQKKWQNRFDYLLVDEFQDTNLDQYEIIKLLSKNQKNVFAVGDPDQMIYSWRGAQKNIFDLFCKDFENCEIIVLEKNYRSTKKILNIANTLIDKNKNRIKKNLYSEYDFKSEILYFEAEDQDEESKFVCAKIKELTLIKKYRYQDIAILYRANYVSRNIEEFLLYNKIPYRIFGGFRFYQRKEIKDIIAYLRIIATGDEISLNRIYNIPKRQISETAYFKIRDYANTHNIYTFAAFECTNEIDGLSSRAKTAVKTFHDLIKTFQTKKYGSIADLIDEIVSKTGYLEMLKSDGEEYRIENINELKNAAISFEKNNPNTNLSFYLQELALLTGSDENDKYKNQLNSVSLMTVHAAKGLEFKVVFIIQFNEAVFPSQRSIEEGNLDEERRIAYVAITRAKEHLYLSCSGGDGFYGNRSVEKTPSRFLIEIGDLINYQKISKKTSILKAINQQKSLSGFQQNHNSKDKNYSIGDFIIHDLYGTGMVLDVKPSTIKISFDDARFGTKLFIKNHKTIRKIKN